MKFNKKFILPIIVLIIIIIAVIIYINTKNEKSAQENSNTQIITQDNIIEDKNENIGSQNDIENTNSKEENEKINELKDRYGFTGDNSLYNENNNELSIKPDLAYRTALIGSLKQRKPTYAEINNTKIDGEPINSGIWVSPNSREIFLNCINNVENSFEIDESGYLKIKSGSNGKYSQKINEIIQRNSLVVIDMTGIDYIIDVVTGDIFKNEFEAMDPYQVYEYFDYETANKSIISLNSNQMNKLSNEEIITTMIDVIR